MGVEKAMYEMFRVEVRAACGGASWGLIRACPERVWRFANIDKTKHSASQKSTF